MGDNILKTKLLALALFSGLLQADASMSWVDQKIDEIKPQRKGLHSATLARLKSPFIYVKGTTTKGVASTSKSASSTVKKKYPAKKNMSGAPLTLQMLLNSSAMINNKWYKENALIRGYKLTQIKNGFVVLKRKNKIIKLFIAQKNKKLNISTK